MIPSQDRKRLLEACAQQSIETNAGVWTDANVDLFIFGHQLVGTVEEVAAHRTLIEYLAVFSAHYMDRPLGRFTSRERAKKEVEAALQAARNAKLVALD